MEEKRQRKKSWRAWAAAAAAAVFILGGTLLQQGLREREEDYDYDAPTVYRSAASDSGYSGQVALGAASKFKMGSSYESAGAEQYSDDAQAQEKIIRTAGFTLKTTAFDADLQAFEELVRRFEGRVEAFYQRGDAGAGEARSASSHSARAGRSGGGASASRLIQAQPPHVSQRTGVRSTSPGRRLCSENVRGRDTNVLRPSRS